MKPKDFQPLHSFGQRCVYIHDRVWHVPMFYDRYEDFRFPGWGDPQLFGNDHPLYVEYCSGNGTWIAERAQQHPASNWVAVEKRYDRVRKIWAKIKNLKLNNLLAVWAGAEIVTRHYFLADSVDGIFINFPDPWPKTRHHKHRLMQDAFIQDLQRVMKPTATLMLVTDDVTYSDQSIDVLRSGGFTSRYQSPYYVEQVDGYGTSFFDTLWREHGRSIRYHEFTRVAHEHSASLPSDSI